MSIRAIRRALGLSEAAATAAGLLESGRLAAASMPGGGATNPRGPGGPGGPSMAEVLAAVSRDSGIDCKTLVAPGQRQPVVRARQLVTYLIRELCPRTSLPAIGFLLNRDHTTVLYSCRRAAALLRRDRAFREAYRRTRRALIVPADRSRG
ncbi:MAG: helix-turn-helix domain-containing protein [Kiloniellales bacterium]